MQTEAPPFPDVLLNKPGTKNIHISTSVFCWPVSRKWKKGIFFLLPNNRLRRNVKRSKINSHTGANGIPSKHRLQTGGGGYCCLITKEEVNKTFGLNSVIRRMLQDSKNNNKHNLYIHVFYFNLLTNIGVRYLCLWKIAITFFILKD